MNNIKNKIISNLANVLENETKKEAMEWPPICEWILFEPERPSSNEEFEVD